MYKTYVFILFILLFGCIREQGGSYTSFIENQTNSQINLYYYKSGKIDTLRNLTIPPNQTSLVLSTAGSDGLFSYPTEIRLYEYDSLLITFNNIKRKINYTRNVKGNNPNALSFENPRNLFNEDNWVEKIIVDKRKRSVREYKFTFTEEDYLKADSIK